MANWNKALLLGDHSLDEHHQELFALETLLEKAMCSHQMSDLEGIILFLEHYVSDHFQQEETLMQSHQFDGYDAHKEDHDHFTRCVDEIRFHFDAKQPLTHLIFKIRRLLDQLMAHIQHVDIKIAPLVRSTHE